MIEKVNYCYKVMFFKLKNVSVTYQRMMNKVFENQIGQNFEVYVHDIIVKSNTSEQDIADFAELLPNCECITCT